MKLPNYEVELSLTNVKECEATAKELVKLLKPEWNIEKVKTQVFTTGITNKIFSIYEKEDNRLVFRVFGKNTEKIIDRSHELESWAILSKEGLAAPLYATFSNGIICGYLPGKALCVENVRHKSIITGVCKAMAQMHRIEVDTAKEPCGFRKMRTFFDNFVPSFESTSKQQTFAFYFHDKDLKKQIEELETRINALKPEMGFCHNDLLVHNILLNENDNSISFIDYEYADFNYLMFDVGNHFCEYAGVDHPDYSRCPNKEDRRLWIAQYLTFRDGVEPSAEVLDKCMLEIEAFQAMSHLFWCLWALVQSQNSTIDFNFLNYAILRHQQYRHSLIKYVNKV